MERSSAIFSSDSGYAGELAVVADSRGRIHIGWIDKVTGELNYSWVDSPQANNLFEWAEPIIVTTPSGTVSSPSIVVEQDQIYIIYALTLNDNRGVYMTNSSDHGATWLDPALVFDAQAAGWEMVDDPHFSITGDGIYHALWTQMSHPQGIGPLGLYYSQSRDFWKNLGPILKLFSQDPLLGAKWMLLARISSISPGWSPRSRTMSYGIDIVLIVA